MSPLTARPIPRFIADSTREGFPYGEWGERLAAEFGRACQPHAAEAGEPGEIVWYPDRTWGGRTYVPATAPAGEKGSREYFGYVSFERPDEGEPGSLRAVADFTEETADAHPEWKIDLNEEVIGAWHGETDRRDGTQREGAVTLVWGRPLVPGAFAVSAELDGDAADQAPVLDDRLTVVALDDVSGFGDTLYLEVKLWNKRGAEVASESLYDEPEEG
jgi:hypothetical protein